MFKATRQIYNTLKRTTDWKVFEEESDNQSAAWVQFSAKNGPAYKIKFISADDDNDVAVRVFGLVKVSEDKKDKVLRTLNSLNSQYRYVKYVIDDDGDVNVEYDFPARAVNVESCAEELAVRFVRIIDESYAQIMHAMWS